MKEFDDEYWKNKLGGWHNESCYLTDKILHSLQEGNLKRALTDYFELGIVLNKLNALYEILEKEKLI